MKKRIADLTANILNPFLVGVIVIVLVSIESAAGVVEAVKWSLIMIVLSILPIYLFTIYLVSKGKLEGVFANVRRQRTSIYALAVLLAVVGCVILYYLHAPLMLLALFCTGLAAVVIFMGINLWWKISLHTAFISASVAILIILYGSVAAVAVVLVPLIAWARIAAGHHSPAQTLIGAILVASILLVVFTLFGLI